MALIVQKYGGTSVANIERLKHVAGRIVKAKKQGNKMVVVVSALSGTTDTLLNLAHQLTDDPAEREMDMLLSTGEQVSVSLLAMAIHDLGVEAVSFTGPQVGIITDKFHTKARIQNINTAKIKEAVKKNKVVIVAGFQGQTTAGEITTLGRGGSDLTAVALAKALDAKKCEIYTDVDGVFTADPRVVPEARKINQISYDEILELASLGAKVMHSRSVEVGKKFNIPIYVRNSKNNLEGTLITKETKKMEDVVVSGVALNENEAKITLFRVPDKPGVAAKIFQTMAEANVNIDMIIQNKTETKTTDISLTVFKNELTRVMKVIKKAASKANAGRVICDKNIAKVSVVGIGMRSHAGIASKMFAVLAKNKINIDMISTSEIKISCIVKGSNGKKAIRAIHSAFGLGRKK